MGAAGVLGQGRHDLGEGGVTVLDEGDEPGHSTRTPLSRFCHERGDVDGAWGPGDGGAFGYAVGRTILRRTGR